jgi:G6PDH family F420-dependent oxidoreductase
MRGQRLSVASSDKKRVMTSFGYTMMCEQSRPDQLVRDVQVAEDAGFDFSVISDHFNPWLESQGHSGYAWSILGAAAQATTGIPLMTYVTCPTMRYYHPAVVAQKTATMGILSGGRFRLGLGAGENLNEHVVGKRWPAVGVRHEMLAEAVEVITALLDGEHLNRRGQHFDVESARLYDLPDERVPVGIAVSGKRSCALAGRKADLMIATEPKPELGELFDAAGGAGKPRVGQIAVCYDTPREAAVQRAHKQFRWFGLGWKVNADLPAPSSFEAATQFVSPEQVGEQLPCGPDVTEYVEKIRPFVDAGFTEVALVQIGAESQEGFCAWAERELLPALRALQPSF